MDAQKAKAFLEQAKREPFARKLGLELLEVREGYAKVRMIVTEDMGNMFGMCHGGAIFSLMDEAFQVACNSYGTWAVALHVGVSYHSPPQLGSTLLAEAHEVHKTKRTGHYRIEVRDEKGELIASCHAIAYRKGSQIPFLEKGPPE
jgi:acyl-CoA thioesterase